MTRERAALLLTEAADAALPSTAGCCSEDRRCADHQQWRDAARLVTAIRDAVQSAPDEDAAGKAIAAVLRDEPQITITPAQREFALSVLKLACSHTLKSDAEGAALHAAYDVAKEAVRKARTPLEMGLAVMGGTE